MTAYLAIMANGESVDAVRIGTHFESLTGEILYPISFVNFDLITRDQYAFESDFKKYTMKADFSKFDSLVYRNSFTDAAYKLWRIRGGFGHVNDDGIWTVYDGEHDFMNVQNVTHWKPLPEPPKEEKEEG